MQAEETEAEARAVRVGQVARRSKRRDANEREIVQALRNAGAAVWHLDGPADLLCGRAGRFTTLEVKDGAKPPSARRLTPDEVAYAGTCREYGLPHYVVTSVEQALEAVCGPILAGLN